MNVPPDEYSPQKSINPRTIRQFMREKRSLRSDQNKNTALNTENTSMRNRTVSTAQTNSSESILNSNKITHRKNTSGINLSEGDDGTRVESSLTTSSEGAGTTAHFIDWNFPILFNNRYSI